MFAPGLKASAIGRMVYLVVQALRVQGHEVSIVRCESTQVAPDELIDFGVPTIFWAEKNAVRLVMNDCDAPVYHVGDNYLLHEGGLYWLARTRGIVCLHDFFLGNLFLGWTSQTKNFAQSASILSHWYGEEMVDYWERHAASIDFIEKTHRAAPLTEWIASQASAVVSHSTWGMGRVLLSCPGPIRVVPLPYVVPSDICMPTAKVLGHGKRLLLLTIGHVNPNKRAECVIKAIGGNNTLRDCVTYTLAGYIELGMRQHLEKLAAEMSVDLRICGEVTDKELCELLSASDVVCCLRNPTLEAASASTIEAMLAARAVIVEDLGFYSELPDDCVCKIHPENEEADLTAVLLELAADPIRREALGERASAWAKRIFSAENYAQQLIELIPLSRRGELVSGLMDSFAHQLEKWGGAASALSFPETLKNLDVFDVDL